jgi:hypothetical protein
MFRRMRSYAAILGLLLLTCSDADSTAARPLSLIVPTARGEPVSPLSPVVLVTVDGVRFQDVFRDADERAGAIGARMPILHSLMTTRGAAIGAPGFGRIDASGPNFVSMPGYTEIFTGKPGLCASNDCGQTVTPTFLDELAALGASVAVFASWEKIAGAATSAPGSFFLSAGRSEHDASDPFPGSGAYRPDRLTEGAALDYLRTMLPDVLVIDLGDCDEHAHHGDTQGYLRALEQFDSFLGALDAALFDMGSRGAETHVFVTTDHGRAKNFRDHGGAYPESGRVWLAASGPRIAARGLMTTRPHHLADVASTVVAAATRASADGVGLQELFRSE